MTIDYMGDGKYIGTLHRHNGASVLYGMNRTHILMSLIEMAYGKEKQPRFREEEEAWTNDDWERDFEQNEINNQHKDDDKI